MGKARRRPPSGRSWLPPWRKPKAYPSAAVLTSDGSYVPYPSWSFAAGLELIHDSTPARWIEESLARHPWATVGNLVPDEFEAYVRILHPAYRGDDDGKAVPWRDVAAMNGTTLHPLADFRRLAGLPDDPNAEPSWGRGPSEGDLPTEVARPLLEILCRHAPATAQCWFCVWYGWGTLFALVGYDEDGYPHVKTPGRKHVLLRGALEMATHVSNDEVDGPSIWWPDDRSWCVATEIDLVSTYVGGSEALARELLEHPALEAFPVTLSDDVSVNADTINPARANDVRRT